MGDLHPAQLSWLSRHHLRKWKTEIGFVLFAMIAVYLIQGVANIDIVVIMPLLWIILGLTLSEQLTERD